MRMREKKPTNQNSCDSFRWEDANTIIYHVVKINSAQTMDVRMINRTPDSPIHLYPHRRCNGVNSMCQLHNELLIVRWAEHLIEPNLIVMHLM